MNIIAQPTTFALQEQGPTSVTTIEAAVDRDTALAKFDEQIRQHPVRYRPWTNFRLVIVEAKDGDQ